MPKSFATHARALLRIIEISVAFGVALVAMSGCSRDTHVAADGTVWYLAEDVEIPVVRVGAEQEPVKWVQFRAGDTVIREHLTRDGGGP